MIESSSARTRKSDLELDTAHHRCDRLTLVYRFQMNQITGFQDGSSIYASSLDVQRGLRAFAGGRLATQNFRGRELLPANPAECSAEQKTLNCFRAGEI